MAIITEDILEQQAIEWFKEIGYKNIVCNTGTDLFDYTNRGAYYIRGEK